MKSVLLTGFEPFGGHVSNPSAEIAQHFDGEVIDEHLVTGVVLSYDYDKSLRQLKAHIRRTNPELIICLGLAAGRPAINPERVAINMDDAAICDNAGNFRNGSPILARGPVGYWSTLPNKAIVAALLEQGIPASLSQTAGTFVCNHVFYGLMHALRRTPTRRGGFIHIPAADGSSDRFPTLPITQLKNAVEIAISTSLRIETDSIQAGGAVH
jgi:pyroglutamyl-peptidase